VSVEQSGETWNIRELWRTTLGTQIHAPVFHENHIYLNANENDNLKGGGRNAPGMVCFDLDGNVRWQSDNQPGIDRGGFIVVDGRAYLLNGQSGQIHLIQLTPEGYREVDTAKVFETGRNNQNIWGPMALSDGYLVVRDQLTIKCLDLRPSRQASAR
jgi:outer membrane protein assembly factor BamB